MKVLVDTSVWSLAFRRAALDGNPYVEELKELINELRAEMIGPIRQEVLSGISHKHQFRKLRRALSVFPDLAIISEDYERAAEFFNINRSKGIQRSNTDFLICAVSARCQMPILSTDKDFEQFQKNLPIQIHLPRNQ